MIGKADLTQALALLGSGMMQTKHVSFYSGRYQTYRRGKYGRNKNRTCKLLRRIKTTC